MTEIDRDELQRLWVGSTMTARELAVHFRTTAHTIKGAIRRAREAEGIERWPHHQPPTHRLAVKRPAPPPRAGRSTLPPLASLDP